MIAACPKCGARYRVERARLEAGGVRLRCARCEAVFRVRPPEPRRAAPAPAPAARPAQTPPSRDVSITPEELRSAGAVPSAGATAPGPLVLIAMPDETLARASAEALTAAGLTVLRVGDGVEAMLEVQRKLPRALVIAADLPKMFGFQVCEVVKRNESLRGTWVVLVGAIHHRERYRRAPDELYGADAYVEGPDLPAGLLPVLARGGLPLGTEPTPVEVEPPAPPTAPVPTASRPEAPAVGGGVATEPAASPASGDPASLSLDDAAAPDLDDVAAPTPKDAATSGADVATPPEAPALRSDAAAPSEAPAPSADDGLDAERAKAERLARIVVSDIVLYNEERFAAAVRGGNVLDAMGADLAEGRQLFEERIDPRVRGERDYLEDELLRRAEARGAA
ncbi:MAG: zinc-ribbon domain-containing protein [Myxococcota bacterium]